MGMSKSFELIVIPFSTSLMLGCFLSFPSGCNGRRHVKQAFLSRKQETGWAFTVLLAAACFLPLCCPPSIMAAAAASVAMILICWVLSTSPPPMFLLFVLLTMFCSAAASSLAITGNCHLGRCWMVPIVQAGLWLLCFSQSASVCRIGALQEAEASRMVAWYDYTYRYRHKQACCSWGESIKAPSAGGVMLMIDLQAATFNWMKRGNMGGEGGGSSTRQITIVASCSRFCL